MKRSNIRYLLIALLGACSGLAVGATDNDLTTLGNVDDLPIAEEAPDLSKKRRISFLQLGTRATLPLRGSNSSAGVGFGVRNDELITSAKLRINYVYSPSVIEKLSHIKVYLNDEVLGVLPLENGDAGHKVQHELNIDPSLISDYNKLRMQLIGHYAIDQCEDPLHTSLWADISGKSSLEFTVLPLPMTNELGLFPEPFFDHRDPERLTLPFVFATKPSLKTLEAATTISSWFGAKASWRGARFPAVINKEPQQHAIVFASNNHRPKFLDNYPKVNEPTIAMISLPQPKLLGDGLTEIKNYNPYIKLLLILGRNDADLKTAAQALTLGQAALSGNSVTIKHVDLGPVRQAYDAPNWVHLDRPTKFGELVESLSELQVAGHTPQTIRVNLRIPADLFTWRSRGVAVDLKYRYTPLIEEDDSRLNVNINEEFVEAFNLRSSGKGGIKKRVRLPLLDEGLFGTGNEFFIPAFKLGSNNQLQFDFSFGYEKQELCKRSATDNVRAAIDADSTIDFTGFPHFVALPNLGFYANSGFPFTKQADLAETAVVLSKNPDAIELETLFTLIGRMGISTGYPATRLELNTANNINIKTNKDLLIIGKHAHDDLLKRWDKELPSNISRLGRELGLPVRAVSLLNDWLGFETKPDPTLGTEVSMHSSGPLGSLVGFESPQAPGRSVVSVLGASNQDLKRVLSALENSGEVSQMRGSTVVIRPQSIESILVGDTYTVGSLPLKVRIWHFLSQHPIILALLTILSVIIIAFLLWRALRVIMSQRLHEDDR